MRTVHELSNVGLDVRGAWPRSVVALPRVFRARNSDMQGQEADVTQGWEEATLLEVGIRHQLRQCARGHAEHVVGDAFGTCSQGSQTNARKDVGIVSLDARGTSKET